MLRHGGGVAGAISSAAGERLQRESTKLAPIDLGEAVFTSAGNLPSRWVIHAATMHLGSTSSEAVIAKATANTLRCAERLGARSLALVAFGAGVGGIAIDQVARIELEELAIHLKGETKLERIVFCVRGAKALQAFRLALARTHAAGQLG
jgi:O-acetyl-ADP-ribose deacetylase (regulator of RNase III)